MRNYQKEPENKFFSYGKNANFFYVICIPWGNIRQSITFIRFFPHKKSTFGLLPPLIFLPLKSQHHTLFSFLTQTILHLEFFSSTKLADTTIHLTSCTLQMPTLRPDIPSATSFDGSVIVPTFHIYCSKILQLDALPNANL